MINFSAQLRHPGVLGDPLRPDFNPLYLSTSGSGHALCMMTTVYLVVLAIDHPRVNLVTIRVTSLIGLIIGFCNMPVNFVFKAELLYA